MSILSQLFSVKFLILYGFILSTIYVHYRGKLKFKLLRQIFDHSSLMAPINVFMYFFSKVPNKPYLNLNEFPELKLLRENWEMIREEALPLLEKGHIKRSDGYDDIGFNTFFRIGWKRFYLKWYDVSLPSAQAMCPKTLKLIESIPCINAAMFTFLPKKSKIGKHRDPYAGSLRYHLGIITPNSDKCWISVDGERYAWKDGEDVLFDETFIHFAENETESDRLIFFCDIKRPMRNKFAQTVRDFFSRYVMSASATKNFDTDKVGVINKIFKYLHSVQLVGKKIKEMNRTLYYTLKYLLVAGIFLAIFSPFSF